MPCPKCKGVLTRDEGVVFCVECFHVLNKEERDQCFGAGREIETNQSIKKEILSEEIQKRKLIPPISQKERNKTIAGKLSDGYVRRIIRTRNKRNFVDDITPEEIEKRRQEILAGRRKRQERKENRITAKKIDELNILSKGMYNG